MIWHWIDFQCRRYSLSKLTFLTFTYSAPFRPISVIFNAGTQWQDASSLQVLSKFDQWCLKYHTWWTNGPMERRLLYYFNCSCVKTSCKIKHHNNHTHKKRILDRFLGAFLKRVSVCMCLCVWKGVCTHAAQTLLNGFWLKSKCNKTVVQCIRCRDIIPSYLSFHNHSCLTPTPYQWGHIVYFSITPVLIPSTVYWFWGHWTNRCYWSWSCGLLNIPGID